MKADEYKLYDPEKYTFEQFTDKTIDFEMNEAFKYQYKNLKTIKIKILDGTKPDKKLKD